MSTIEVVVRRAWAETPEIRALELVACEGELPAFTPGAHIDVHLGPGLVRQYSLCNSPIERDRYLIGVKREPQSRGGSQAMHELVQTGDRLRISPPRNKFPLVDTTGDSVLLAGGIGVTPLLSMAHHLKAAGRPFAVHYFTRSPEHTAFRTLMAREGLDQQVRFYHGLVPPTLDATVTGILRTRSTGAHLYLCGPAPFMELVRATAAAQGWPEAAVHLEHFGAQPAPQEGNAFELELARSGRTLEVPRGVTILEVLRTHGIEIETSCEQGVCGTCLTRVIEGVPDHQDLFLQPEEQASGRLIMPCVSRALSRRLVLDL